VIDEVAQLGGRMVQFIGGEPTLHRGLPDLVQRALDQGLEVEVFTNLVHVSWELWETFAHRRLRLATSYYSDDAAEHETITRGRGNHARTKANIAEALRRSIPSRIGLVYIENGQRVEQARAELEALGVTEIGTDHLRRAGPAAGNASRVSISFAGTVPGGKSRCRRTVMCGRVCSRVGCQ
jgi:MoaA/NifB/PqqE/SkfB family radical SAM enzyme